MKKKKLGKRLIHSFLLDSVFDPNIPGPMTLVVGLDDPNYSELKAIELIQEARSAYKVGYHRTYHDKMEQATSLLALARAQRGPISSEEAR